jgi:phage terminase large subunit-like protein
MVVGINNDNHGFVLEDLSGIYTPNQWAEKAVTLIINGMLIV